METQSWADYVAAHPLGRIAVGVVAFGLLLIVTGVNAYVGSALALGFLSLHLRRQNANTVVESSTP